MLKRISWLLAAGVLLSAGSALAQTATVTGTGGAVDITITGTVQSAVKLDVTGSGGTTLTATTSANAPAAAVGTLDFGTFSAINPSSATNASYAGRTTSGTPGAIVAGTLSATLTYSGVPTGSVTLKRKNPAGALPDVPLANLRIGAATATWTSETSNTQIPDATAAGYNICQGDPTCVSGKAYAHQVAVFVPDTQAAGAFTTVIEYIATAP